MLNSNKMEVKKFVLSCILILISGTVLVSGEWPVGMEVCPGKCQCSSGTITCTKLKKVPEIPPGINTVILTKCQISTLEDNVFKNMTNVTSLIMRHLNMDILDGSVVIKPNAFIGLDNLQELELSSSYLQIPSDKFDAFDPLFNLKSLNLTGAGIMSNDVQHILKNITQLEILDLSHGMIDKISVDLADNLKHLKHVRLAMNAFTTIDDAVNVFQKSTDLEYLDLSAAFYTRPGSIPITKLGPVFKTFTEPLTLKLNNAIIPKIGDDFFDNAQTVAELYIKDCSIDMVTDNAFNKLSKIEILDISTNPKLTFKNVFSSLKDVYISQLVFHDNQIDTEINIDLVRLLENTSIEILDLSHGQIETIGDQALTSIQNLTELYLSYNKIQTLKNMGEFLKLKTLDLQHNQLVSLKTKMFDQIYFLKYFYLNDNLLEDMEEYMLDTMGHLEVLDISNNNIGFLGDYFLFPTISLKTLKLSSAMRPTQQSKWHKLFEGLWKLEILHMQNNGITELKTNTFRYLQVLQEVDISGNKLESLPVGLFTQMSRLQSVKANNNLIKTIDVKVFDKLNNLTLLDISMNPFDCVCELVGFANWLVNNSLVLNSNQTKCATPEELQNTTLATYALDTPINCFIINQPELPVGFVVVFVFFILIGILAVVLVFYLVRNRLKKTLAKHQVRYGAINDTDENL